MGQMNSGHRRTLACVFSGPVSSTIEWAAVERLLRAVGARMIEGRGQLTRFEKDGEVETFTGRTPPRKPGAVKVALSAPSWNGSE